ncbi:hypothetical protein GCM10009725_28370 [Aeromicrobium tamlense]
MAGISCCAVRSNSPSSNECPSSIEYSVWTCRCTKLESLAMVAVGLRYVVLVPDPGTVVEAADRVGGRGSGKDSSLRERPTGVGRARPRGSPPPVRYLLAARW